MKLDLWLNKRTDITHAVASYGPRTLCGQTIEGDQWKREPAHRSLDESFVECLRCRKTMKRITS